MSTTKVILLFVAVECAIIAVVLLTEGYSLDSLQTIVRFSGRLSLILFSAIFLLYNKPVITFWLSNKFYLLFAIVHGIHLMELLLYNIQLGAKIIPIRLAGGVAAYAYTFAMPVLQQLRANGRVSTKTFSTLEVIFIYYIWLIFFLTYLPRVQGKLPLAGGSFAEHVALLGWVSTLLGMKLTSLISFKKSRER